MQKKQALISVTDKMDICELAEALIYHKYEIIATGGTALYLKKYNISIHDVSELTGYPEILGGRVKTLHPRIFGGILANRLAEEHRHQMQRFGLPDIEIVVVNLYQFETVCFQSSVKLEDAIEAIDIGGVSLIRAAAKNFESITVITSPAQYDMIIMALHQNAGMIPRSLRLALAVEGFKKTSQYDKEISSWLENWRMSHSSNKSADILLP